MTLPIEIAQLPTLDTVQSTTRLLVQDGVTGTPYQQTTVGKVFLDLVDEIGTGTIVAGDVVISGGTADLDLLIAAEGTITDATIIGGTGTFATGSISTLAVAGTLTAETKGTLTAQIQNQPITAVVSGVSNWIQGVSGQVTATVAGTLTAAINNVVTAQLNQPVTATITNQPVTALMSASGLISSAPAIRFGIKRARLPERLMER